MKKLHKLCDVRLTLSRCRWKNGCNGRWKKQCCENECMINSILIETMNAMKWLKKWKNCVKCSLIYKMKKIEKFIFMRTTANKKSYRKRKFWNFTKRLIQLSWIKKNYDVWSNKSKSKINFLMNCRICPCWLNARRKVLMKNWQHSLKTKNDFWLMNFFWFHFRLIWITFSAQRICCRCTV